MYCIPLLHLSVVLKSGLVFCVLSLVRSDSLYFSSLHFSSLSLRVVSHQQCRPVQYYTQVLTIKEHFHSKPSNLIWPACFYFPSSCSFLLFSFCCPPVRLLLSWWYQSVWQSSGIMFDTVRWPGKLKTQLKWQSRGQLFCISKALLWLFCANYIR